ncbi:MAG: hypothetical protein QOG64_1489, partial [Acidimicrobiaceae bacterium]|nr:hypothetical protein [Acidimicrobiaceae bacterium]
LLARGDDHPRAATVGPAPTTTPTTTAPAADDPDLTAAPPGATAPSRVPVAKPAAAKAPVPLRKPVSCRSAGPPHAAAFPGADPRDGQEWVTVGSLSGNCDGSSAGFHIRGVDTRLLYRSDADSIAVFLVDAKQGIDATAGFADGECSGPCSINQVLVDPAGDYSLLVQAGDGPWEVLVQEYRRP